MPQTANRQGHDYETPPHVIGCLIHGTTWALWCRKCSREVKVDIIGLLERPNCMTLCGSIRPCAKLAVSV